MAGQNSRKTFIPASLPMVEPKSANTAELVRAQRAVSRSHGSRSQHSQQIRRVQGRFARIVAGNHRRERRKLFAQRRLAGGRVIARVLLQQRRVQELAQKGAGFSLHNRCLVERREAGLHAWSGVLRASRRASAFTPAAPKINGDLASSTNAWNLSALVTGCGGERPAARMRRGSCRFDGAEP